jgi:hypothetical protein
MEDSKLELWVRNVQMILTTNYGHTMAKFLIFVSRIYIPIPNKDLGLEYKGLVFCSNNGSNFSVLTFK